MALFFFNEDAALKLKNKIRLKNWLKSIIFTEGKSVGDISVVLCTDAFLLSINKTYLKHDTYTDIITFQYSNLPDKSVSGDIYISVERIEENAKLFTKTFQEELNRVMAHGVLHLLGYKDKKASDKTKMRAKEDYYLSLLTQIK